MKKLNSNEYSIIHQNNNGISTLFVPTNEVEYYDELISNNINDFIIVFNIKNKKINCVALYEIGGLFKCKVCENEIYFIFNIKNRCIDNYDSSLLTFLKK